MEGFEKVEVGILEGSLDSNSRNAIIYPARVKKNFRVQDGGGRESFASWLLGKRQGLYVVDRWSEKRTPFRVCHVTWRYIPDSTPSTFLISKKVP